MAKASKYEREFLWYLSQRGIVGRFAGSGAINTVLGDLVLIHPRSSGEEPWIVEVKSTHKKVYYPSQSVFALSALSKYFAFKPVLAVRFVDYGWKVIDLSSEVPPKVTREGAEFLPIRKQTVWDWLVRVKDGEDSSD